VLYWLRKEGKKMEKHVTVVGAVQIGFGALKLLAALTLFGIIVGEGLLGGVIWGDKIPIAVTAFVGTAIALWLAVLSVPEIVGGIGLLRWKSWARYLVLVLAVVDLFSIPVGTAVGVYSIWVLVQDETAELFGPCC
jgi:hypothetical protein